MRLLILATILTISHAIDPLALSLPEVLEKYHDVSLYAKDIGIEEFDEGFENFKKTHNRHYDHAELDQRKYNFLDTLNYNKQHNELFGNGQVTHEVGITKFADWSDEEFNAILKTIPSVKISDPVLVNDTDYYNDYSNNPLPETFDWRDQHKVTSIKDQGNCGGCWSFATCATIESQYAINQNILVSLSEQELLDCSTAAPYDEDGCNGGSIDGAMTYVKQQGITELEEYPFIDVNYQENQAPEQCYSNEVENSFKVSGYKNFQQASDQQIMQLIVNNGPVVGLICADGKDFQHYITHSERPISTGCTGLDHAITIVGYNTESWIIKNSWSVYWGEKGYGYIARGNNVRGINDDIYLPTL